MKTEAGSIVSNWELWIGILTLAGALLVSTFKIGSDYSRTAERVAAVETEVAGQKNDIKEVLKGVNELNVMIGRLDERVKNLR